MGEFGRYVELRDAFQQFRIRHDGAVGFHFHGMIRQQAQQGVKRLLLNERLPSGQDQAAAWIMEHQFSRLFRREAHSGNRSVPGIRRITPGTGQIAACQTQEDAGCSLGDSFSLNGMENFRLSVNLGQCEHDRAGLRLSYPCRPSTTP